MAEQISAEKLFLLMNGVGTFLINNLMREFLEDDDDDLVFQYLCHGRKRRRLDNATKPTGFAETFVPSMNDRMFRSYFRLTRTNFELLVSTIGPFISRDVNFSGRKTTDVNKQVLIVLWLMATPDSYRLIGERFGVSKGIVYRCYMRVVQALNLESVRKQFIVWPTGDEAQKVMDEFQRKAGFPDVVGAIGGSHIAIKPPNPPEPFYTKKNFHAVTLLACCDPHLKFTYCIAGFPGSYNEATTVKQSDLPETHEQLFCNDTHLVGDSPYPTYKWLLAPYKDYAPLTPSQKNFNHCHAKTRLVIDHAFRLFKNRFRRFKERLDLNHHEMYGPTIVAGCIVHNIALIDDADVTEFMDEDDEEIEPDSDTDLDISPTQGDRAGFMKRAYICKLLM